MRTSNQITESEVKAYAAFCATHNIINDGGPDDVANSNFILDYFVNQWKEEISAATLAQAFPQLKPHLKFQSQSEVELRYTAAASDPTLTTRFAEWFEKQKFLVNEGPDGFANAANLLQELRGRDIAGKDFNTLVMQAVGRIEAPTSKYDTRVRKPLHYVKVERALSLAAQASEAKTGEFISRSDMIRNADGSYRSKTYAEQKRDREQAEAAKSPATNTLSETDRGWMNLTQGLLAYGTHSQQFQVKKVYDAAVAQGLSWRNVFEACDQLVSSYKRAAEVSFRRY